MNKQVLTIMPHPLHSSYINREGMDNGTTDIHVTHFLLFKLILHMVREEAVAHKMNDSSCFIKLTNNTVLHTV